MDPIEQMKAAGREAWGGFVPFEVATGTAAPKLVAFAGVAESAEVLDVACGTGVVAVTAARLGARVTGLDLAPRLLERAQENAALAGAAIEFREGDVEALPFEDGHFDFVLSQFGHMFGPRPEIATAEMLRVLRPGGTIAFSTWPPDVLTGRMFSLLGRYAPPPPDGVGRPTDWGVPEVVEERLGDAVRDLVFDRDRMAFQTLSPAHMRLFMEENAAPVQGLVKALSETPERLAAFRAELDALIAVYFRDNVVRQDFLMSRAIKV